MTLTAKAQRVMERGLAAFRNMKVRPEAGHTTIHKRVVAPSGTRLQFGCVVGAIAYEAAALQGLSNLRAQEEAMDDDNAKAWVARLFGVTVEECCQIESGFDRYFSCRQEHPTNQMMWDTCERQVMEDPEMVQVGWHVAKRATKHYMDLDAAETEAWHVYQEKDLASYEPRRPLRLWRVPPRDERGRFMSEAQIDAAIANTLARIEEECEGDDCPEDAQVVMHLA